MNDNKVGQWELKVQPMWIRSGNVKEIPMATLLNAEEGLINWLIEI